MQVLKINFINRLMTFFFFMLNYESGISISFGERIYCVFYNVLIFNVLDSLRSVDFPTLNILMYCGIRTYVIRLLLLFKSLNDFLSFIW